MIFTLISFFVYLMACIKLYFFTCYISWNKRRLHCSECHTTLTVHIYTEEWCIFWNKNHQLSWHMTQPNLAIYFTSSYPICIQIIFKTWLQTINSYLAIIFDRFIKGTYKRELINSTFLSLSFPVSSLFQTRIHFCFNPSWSCQPHMLWC